MKIRGFVAVALISGLFAGVSISTTPVFAQENAAPAGADQKIQQLEKCIKHFKRAREGWSQDPITQQSYSKKIGIARDKIAALKGGQDISQKEIDKACESPHTAPY